MTDTSKGWTATALPSAGQILNDALQSRSRVTRFEPADPCYLLSYYHGGLLTDGLFSDPEDAMRASDVGRWISIGSDGYRSEDGRHLILRHKAGNLSEQQMIDRFSAEEAS